MSYLQKAKEMYDMIQSGQMLDAFEKYYHDDVVMVEATSETREGKDKNREFEVNWLSSIADLHGGGVTAITSNEETGHTSVETWMDVSFKDGTRYKMEEVAVQKWQGDQIIHERFYYNVPGQ